MRRGAATGSWVLSRGEEGYPECLEELGGRAPRRIYGLGRLDLVAGIVPADAVTIVGARRSGTYGRSLARELGYGAGAAGLVVVSGMAIGCDSEAHEGALEGEGATIAVLGGGPDMGHPRSCARLHRRVLESGGAVIAEHPPGTSPIPGFFPARNRIMAALASLTVVVEGAMRSGTRHTANEAADLGRMVAAVPGPVTSGLSDLPNQLIKEGAHMLRDAQDLLDLGIGAGALQVRGIGAELEPVLAHALLAVEGGASTCDAVALELGPGGGSAPVALARLELLGYVAGDAVGRYSRTRLKLPPGAMAPD